MLGHTPSREDDTPESLARYAVSLFGVQCSVLSTATLPADDEETAVSLARYVVSLFGVQCCPQPQLPAEDEDSPVS